MARRVIPIAIAEALIPQGMYCYTLGKDGIPGRTVAGTDLTTGLSTKPCPFWSLYDPIKHGPLPADLLAVLEGDEYRGGYCDYLKLGDWMENGPSLLWDQVKECGIKDDLEAEDLYG